MKGTVAHNVHHILSNSNYTLLPWHHLLSTKAMQKDVDSYNKLLKTEIRTELFFM